MKISITGAGAVSPAGWGLPPLLEALQGTTSLQISEITRPFAGGELRTPVLRVPAAPPTAPKFARLRRTSPISRFAAFAAAEALGPERLELSAEGKIRIGVIFTLTNGCVNYSNRFYGEVLDDPSVASPIFFPETVFNAPSSHLSAMIGSRAPNDTLVSDSTGIFSGIDLAAEWILRGEVDGCLVVAAEETDWLSAEGLRHYSASYLPSEGAAAVYLEAADEPVKLLHLPDPVSFSSRPRAAAAREIHRQLAPFITPDTLLLDGTTGISEADAPELDAWETWTGIRWSPRRILGESMGASSALQIAAAVAAIQAGIAPRTIITATGSNQQAAGLVLDG